MAHTVQGRETGHLGRRTQFIYGKGCQEQGWERLSLDGQVRLRAVFSDRCLGAAGTGSLPAKKQEALFSCLRRKDVLGLQRAPEGSQHLVPGVLHRYLRRQGQLLRRRPEKRTLLYGEKEEEEHGAESRDRSAHYSRTAPIAQRTILEWHQLTTALSLSGTECSAHYP